MSLGDQLIADVKGALTDSADGVSRTVVLWFDPEGEWTRAVRVFEPRLVDAGIELIELPLDGGQITAKFRLLTMAEGKSAVVYLSGWSVRDLNPDGESQPRLWSVVEFEFVGAIWGGGTSSNGPTIIEWLERHDVRLSGGAAVRKRVTAGGGNSKLARWLERNLTNDWASLPHPLRETDITEIPGADPRDAIALLLVDPRGAMEQWGEDRQDIIERISTRYGLQLEATDPDDLADTIAVAAALCEAWDAFGRSADFPFIARLPADEAKRLDLAKLLRTEWLPRGDVAPELLRRTARHELALYELISWSADRAGYPRALPRLAHARWLLALERISVAAAETWRAAATALEGLPLDNALDPPVIAGLPSTAWPSLQRARSLLAGAARSIDAAATASIGELFVSYRDEWWQIDRDYLEFRRAADRHPELASVRLVLEAAYSAYLEATASRLTQLLGDGDPREVPIRSIRDVAAELWPTSGDRRATLVIDAFRWDLAQMLRLRIGESARLEAALSTLPSTTPFGMSSLLPLDDPPKVTFGTKGVALHVGKHEISAREGRKAYLQEWFQSHQRSVAFLELDDVVQGKAIPPADHVVVFNYALDQTGHAPATTANLPAEAETGIGRLDIAIQQMQRAKIRRIDVVTDHGFLYLDPDSVNALGRPKVVASNTVNRGPRYAILKADAPAPDVIRIEAPLAPGTFVAIPRGIRTLQQADAYLHGGVSLQECVIPHLIVESKVAPALLSIAVTPTSTQIAGGTVPFVLRPTNPQMTLEATARRRIRLWLEASVATGERHEVADPIEVEVRSNSPDIQQALFLRDGVTLPAGATVYLRARDADTMADLSESPLTLLVDWG